jgi:glycosyltransferase involved in cell wall biosynthesis
VAHLDSERAWRGGQAQIESLVLGLAEHGVVSCVHCPPGPLAERLARQGVALRPFGARFDLDLAAALRLARAWRAESPDLVHLHSARAHAVGALAARWAGRLPVVVSRRVDFRVGGTPWGAFKYRHGVDRFVSVSHGVDRVLAEAGIPPARRCVVPSGIPLERWQDLPPAHELRARLGLAPDHRVVGALAALAPHKDHATLLAAARVLAARRPDVRWVVFGEGECRRELEAQRRRLGLEGIVLFPGFAGDVREAMALLEVFVSSSYLEGLGTSLLDAQAAGVPVVATAVGGVPEIVAHGESGWLVPPRSPEALQAAVEEALSRPAEAARRAGRARQTVRRFSAEATVRATLAVYREVLAERRP